jgi:hypothetical protein
MRVPWQVSGEIKDLIDGFAQFDSDAVDCLDGIHLVQLHG